MINILKIIKENIDDILDKISDKGVESLNTIELYKLYKESDATDKIREINLMNYFEDNGYEFPPETEVQVKPIQKHIYNDPISREHVKEKGIIVSKTIGTNRKGKDFVYVVFEKVPIFIGNKNNEESEIKQYPIPLDHLWLV